MKGANKCFFTSLAYSNITKKIPTITTASQPEYIYEGIFNQNNTRFISLFVVGRLAANPNSPGILMLNREQFSILVRKLGSTQAKQLLREVTTGSYQKLSMIKGVKPSGTSFSLFRAAGFTLALAGAIELGMTPGVYDLDLSGALL